MGDKLMDTILQNDRETIRNTIQEKDKQEAAELVQKAKRDKQLKYAKRVGAGAGLMGIALALMVLTSFKQGGQQ
jgi:hypothetical protein